MSVATARQAPLTLVRAYSASAGARLRAPRPCILANWPRWLNARHVTTTTTLAQEVVPLRKHLKDEAKRKKNAAKANNAGANKKRPIDPRLEQWELTVGIEIHAELNTAQKLFSPATTEASGTAPNSRVALF
ncbi:hypothetical protein KC352_g37337, partial [Hortaea werneckii]